MFFLQIPSRSIHWWCPILIWFVLLGFFCAICLAIQDGVSQLKRLHQIPCTRCAFYTGEYRLKCTVNPYQAFTENAIDCRDWEPKLNGAACLFANRRSIFKFFTQNNS